MLIFLDFDGCLHPQPCYEQQRLFCFRDRFESVMRDFPATQIVISSDWRHNHPLDELRSYFSADIAARITDVTPVWTDLPELFDSIGYRRQTECVGWLREHGRPWDNDWIAVDDCPWLFRPFCSQLIQCDPEYGFDDRVEKILRDRLTQRSGRPS